MIKKVKLKVHSDNLSCAVSPPPPECFCQKKIDSSTVSRLASVREFQSPGKNLDKYISQFQQIHFAVSTKHLKFLAKRLTAVVYLAAWLQTKNLTLLAKI